MLEGLTIVELFAGRGKVSERLMNVGAEQAVCVDDDPPEDKIEMDGIVWIPLDVFDFLSEERVQEVGLVYSAPPYGSDLNRDVLGDLKAAPFLEKNCIVIIEEATWDHTNMKNFETFEVIEDREFGETRIVITQMVSAMGF